LYCFYVFFLLLCFLCFYCYYVFIDVRLSHLNKDYLLTYLLLLLHLGRTSGTDNVLVGAKR